MIQFLYKNILLHPDNILQYNNMDAVSIFGFL